MIQLVFSFYKKATTEEVAHRKGKKIGQLSLILKMAEEKVEQLCLDFTAKFKDLKIQKLDAFKNIYGEIIGFSYFASACIKGQKVSAWIKSSLPFYVFDQLGNKEREKSLGAEFSIALEEKYNELNTQKTSLDNFEYFSI